MAWLLGAALLVAVFTVVVAPRLFSGGPTGFVTSIPGLPVDGTLGRIAREPVADYPLVETSGLLELSGEEVLVISGEHRVHRGNIVLRDRARLEIRDATLDHVQGSSFEFTLEAHDEATVVVTHAEVRSSDWLNWNFFDHASLTLDDTEQRESRIWHYCADRCEVTIRGARFHGTLDHEAHADIEDAPDVSVELVWPNGVVVDERLPTRMEDYHFPNEGESGIPISLDIRRSTASNWGLTMRAASDVTLRDTEHLTVTIAIGEPWEGATVELSDLREQRYDDRTWTIVDSTLRLVNTRTNRWSPIVGNGNTLVLRDSDLADQAFSWGDGRVVIEDSSLQTVRARDQVQITVRGSRVIGDVVAQDDGTITLIGTRVGGAVVESDNGRVIRDDVR